VSRDVPDGTLNTAGNLNEDQKWMRRALERAAEAALQGEIPVGAVIVSDGEIIAEAANLKESNGDPLGHAEILAIRKAAEKLGRWRLSGCTLYVTLEPCTMCSGAIIHARLDRVVYAATDPKAGAVRSLYQILSDPRLNHTPEITSGVLEEEAAAQLKTFFRQLRSRPRDG
jgi:tRNA(adenine34) deaminase